MKAYKTRRDIPLLDHPFLHVLGDPVPPPPPTIIHSYADARITIAQMCYARLFPPLEVIKLYFRAYIDSENTAWGGRTGDELIEDRGRFKAEFLEHVHTFIPQIEALKGFIELGRKDIGQTRTDFLLRGTDTMLVYLKEMTGPKAKDTLVEDDMIVPHRIFTQFGLILNSEFQIKWQFPHEKLVSGGGIEKCDTVTI